MGGGGHSGRGLRELACERGWVRHEIRLGGAHWWGVEGWGRGRREGWGYVTVRKGDGRGGEGVIYPTAGLLDSYSQCSRQ